MAAGVTSGYPVDHLSFGYQRGEAHADKKTTSLNSPVALVKFTSIQEALDYLKQHPIASEKKRYCMIAPLLDSCAAEIADRLQEFEFTKGKYFKKIADKIGQIYPQALVKNIRSFHMPNNDQFAWANFLAINQPAILAEHVGNFDLTPEQRFAAALGCARVNGEAAARYFTRFQIPGAACAIAAIAALQNGRGCLRHFERFNITDPQRAFIIIQACFTQDPDGCKKLIGKFPWLTEEQRFQLLTIVFAKDASKALEWVKTYRIQSSAYLFSLAKQAAAWDGWQFSNEVQEWGIPEACQRQQLLEIASIQNPEGPKKYYANYRL
jgi:hypothetical protein